MSGYESGKRWSRAIAGAAMTVAGLVMMVTPLALWVAPDKDTFKLVLLACIAASTAVVLIARIGGSRPVDRGRPAAGRPPGLSDAAIERLQNRGELSRRPLEILRQSEPRVPSRR